MKSAETWILDYLLNSLWQIPLLFAAGWVAAQALRLVGFRAEHRAWVGALLLESLLPACSALPLESLRIRLLWGSSSLLVSSAHVSVVTGRGFGLDGLHVPQNLLAAIAVGYGTVCAYFAARFAWRWRRLHALRLEAEDLKLSGEASLFWAQCSRWFGIEGASLATSAEIFGPVTMGWSRKLVLLPQNLLSGLSEADMRAAIAHEFAHMKRNDFIKNLIYELLTLPVSYHPFLWFTRDRVIESREIVCDQMAAETEGRNRYARSLLRLASLFAEGRSARTLHAIGIFDANTLERRLMRITEKQTELHGVRRLMIVVGCAALGMATCGSMVALHTHVDANTKGGDNTVSKASGLPSISPGEMAEHKLGGPMPKYPQKAKDNKIQGTVLLNAVIGKDGSVRNLTVISGPKELRKSSLDAVRQWKYKPYLLNGSPVEVTTQIRVVYSLEK